MAQRMWLRVSSGFAAGFPAGRTLRWGALVAAAALLSGCGPQYVLLHPVGPVGQSELRLMLLAGGAMAVVILFVFVLLAIAAVRFRDRRGRRAAYVPDWHESRVLELIWFVIPVAIVAIIAVPTLRQTYALARMPHARKALVVDVTSLSWKWFFEYPGQHLATVNHLVLPEGQPVLFELTADSAMNTFWVPQLGGMEYTMPGEVLPLWLQADHTGVFWGHSANFSGLQFEKMFFSVKVVSASGFATWVQTTQRSAPALTAGGYRRLRAFGTTGPATYSGYPAGSFPAISHRFTLSGGQYVPAVRGYGQMNMGLMPAAGSGKAASGGRS